jgi:hypothetical protein
LTSIKSTIPTYTGFSTKKEILNPYSLENNPSKFLEDAWGLSVGPGTRAENDSPVREYYVTTLRDIGVVLCRPVYDVHNIGLALDDEQRTLLFDAATIRDNFLDLAKFGVLKTGENVEYVGDSGINFLEIDDGFKFIYTQIDFTFEIIETIN